MKRLSGLWRNNKVYSECRIRGGCDPVVESVSFSSQHCTSNSVFIAIKGLRLDGHTFISQAIANGARVIVHSEPIDTVEKGVVFIAHPNPRRIASLFCRALAEPLPATIIGITGTDGKSTTCDFLYQILQSMHHRCGILSTITMDDGSGRKDSPYRQSTPEAPELYAFLAKCYQNGLQTVLLETTSHGLSSEGGRLTDIVFSGAIFTTITSEHLEFHQTHDRYVAAKMNLARQVDNGGWVVLPHDFPYRRMVEMVMQPKTKILTYSLDTPNSKGNLQATTLFEDWQSRILSLASSFPLTLPYGPSYYTNNALGAFLAAHELVESSYDTIITACPALHPVTGRFELVTFENPCTIIIDFAHTAGAFEQLFAHIKRYFPHRRLVALFGAAGERDRNKRFFMGRSAAQWCEAIFITDEDPRGEPQEKIEEDIREGIESVKIQREVFSISDRQQAIVTAIEYCESSAILLLLGKGHEKSIQYCDYQIPWNEHDIVIRALRQRDKKHV